MGTEDRTKSLMSQNISQRWRSSVAIWLTGFYSGSVADSGGLLFRWLCSGWCPARALLWSAGRQKVGSELQRRVMASAGW
jgi:hypothetical protein